MKLFWQATQGRSSVANANVLPHEFKQRVYRIPPRNKDMRITPKKATTTDTNQSSLPETTIETSNNPESNTTIITVSELNQSARRLVESRFDGVWIMGEISNLAQPSSGHWYFSLKDERAQVRCAMFRMSQRNVDFEPQNGQHILLQARASLYEARGEFQLIAQKMQLAGAGALQVAFEKLKRKLAAEGLFEMSRKKPLPNFPRCIGVITSATGAAIRDILIVLKRRFPAIPVVIYPTLVQGNAAATQIVTMIETANKRAECDVLILARGGGSLEDLWPFNEAPVAYAIFKSVLPIISGVGHEVDITIADLVADHRAATPSAAAECVSPEQSHYRQGLDFLGEKLERLLKQRLAQATKELQHLSKRLRHPGEQLREYAQRIDQLEQRQQRAFCALIQRKQAKLSELARTLNSVSPLNTLKRGFSILTDEKSGAVITASDQVAPNTVIHARLHEGALRCRVMTPE